MYSSNKSLQINWFLQYCGSNIRFRFVKELFEAATASFGIEASQNV